MNSYSCDINQPIRIAQVMGKMLGGGVESAVMNFYSALDKTKYQFDFIYDCDSTNIDISFIEDNGGRAFQVPRYQDLLNYNKTLINLFYKENWPIVHSHINTLSVFPLRAAKKAGIPHRIAHAHATEASNELLRNMLKHILKPQVPKYSTVNIACANHVGEWMFPNNNYEVITNGIDVDQFRYNQDTRVKIRESLALTDEILFGCVGRLVPVKNFPKVFSVFKEIQKREPKSALVLIGEGHMRSELEHLAFETLNLQNVTFLGLRNDLPELYQALDCVLMPSFSEGFPMVSLEAQASGCPLLGSYAISDEVIATKGIHRLALEDNDEIWANTALSVVKLNKRESHNPSIEQLDTSFSVKKLTNLYDKILKN